MEFIISGQNEYGVNDVSTGIDTISFTMESEDLTATVDAFKEVTSLSVAGEDKAPYGIYDGLTFVSALATGDGNVTITFRIQTDAEKRIASLEEQTKLFSEAMMELSELYTGEEEEVEN